MRGLRLAGHDVLAVKETLRGAGDETVLSRAQIDGRIVVTQDKDFGELAFRHALPASSGIVLFRLDGTSADEDVARMLEVLSSAIDWAGHFSVVNEERVRMRPLPGLRPRGE